MAPRGLPVAAARILATAAALVGPAAAGRAEDAASADTVARLKFEYRCYVEESWGRPKADGYRAMFRERLEKQLSVRPAGAADTAAVEELLARACWDAAKALEKAGDLRGAQPFAARIGRLAGAPESIRAEASDLNDRVSVADMAEARTAKRWDRVRELAEGLLTSRKPAIVGSAAGSLREALAAGLSLDAVAGKNLAKEGETLDALLAAYDGAVAKAFPRGVPAAVQEAVAGAVSRDRDRARTIAESTGWVAFEVLPVGAKFGASFKGPVAAVDASRVVITLTPRAGGGGEAWSGAGALPGRMLFLRGTYDIDASLPGAPRPFARWLRVAVDREVKTLRVPDRAPENMVYVGPWTASDGRHGGFFGGVFEVTVEELRTHGAAIGGVKDILGDQSSTPRAPAWFPEDDQGGGHSLHYAEGVGASVPTVRQWLDLCFGPDAPAERPFPWGTAPVDGSKNAVVGRSSDAGLVTGAMPEGASPYGALDMCGNVAELVRHHGGLWAMGGFWKSAPADFSVAGRNPLRDPAPGYGAYAALPDNAPAGTPSKNAYSTYRAPYADVYSTGLRLVVVIEE